MKYCNNFLSMIFKFLEGSRVTRIPGSFKVFSWLCSIFGNPTIEVFDFRMQTLVYSRKKYVLFYSENYEQNVVNVFKNLLLRRIHPVVIDVGSSIGFYTLLASKLVDNGLIYSIEPDPFRFAVLNNNLTINNAKNVRAINCLASSGGVSN